jgi:hypothetical protein
VSPTGPPSPARTALGAAVLVSGLAAAGRGVWLAGAARRFAAVRGPRFSAAGSASSRAASSGSAAPAVGSVPAAVAPPSSGPAPPAPRPRAAEGQA